MSAAIECCPIDAILFDYFVKCLKRVFCDAFVLANKLSTKLSYCNLELTLECGSPADSIFFFLLDVFTWHEGSRVQERYIPLHQAVAVSSSADAV